MARKSFGLILSLALSFAWAGPLRAESVEPSHACCPGGEAPADAPGGKDVPACCRAPEALPVPAAAAVSAPVPALLPSPVLAGEAPAVRRFSAPRFAPSAPQAPPGTHSGLSPPASGL